MRPLPLSIFVHDLPGPFETAEEHNKQGKQTGQQQKLPPGSQWFLCASGLEPDKKIDPDSDETQRDNDRFPEWMPAFSRWLRRGGRRAVWRGMLRRFHELKCTPFEPF